MKSNKITAALISAVIPFSSGSLFSSTVYAEDTEKVPDWIPSSFEEALDFRNTYGATHIGTNENQNDTVCVVLPKYEDTDCEFNVEVSKFEQTEIFHETFTEENSDTMYEVIAYTNYHQNAGKSNICFTLWRGEDMLEIYDFSTYTGGLITEDDVYSWMPDCITEYEDFVKTNGEVSVKDNYVVFCLDSNAGTSYSWVDDPDEFDWSAIENRYYSTCYEETLFPLDGGPLHKVAAYQFGSDGHFKLTYDYIPMINSPFKQENVKKKLTADCMVLDKGNTILLSGNARFRFVDSDTGKDLIHPNQSTPITLSPAFGYAPEYTGTLTDYEHELTADSNPYIWRNLYKTGWHTFDIELNEKELPYGYLLPEDYKKITTYENGSYDVEFRLKQDTEKLSPKQLRITIYDKETGELIPEEILALHQFSFGTNIRFGDSYTGPIFLPKNNPCIYNDSYLPGFYKSADAFSIISKDQPEITYYDNSSMDIVFRIKIEAYGDVNGDGGFTVADLVRFEKMLLTGEGNEYDHWYDADFCVDGKLDVFDLCIMRKKLIERINNTFTDLEYQCVDVKETNGHAGYPQKALIKNNDELKEFIKDKSEKFNMDNFEKAAEKYTDEWFSEHKLIVVAVEESSINNIVKVKGIIRNLKDKYTDETKDYLQIETFYPNEHADLIAHRMILTEIDSSLELNDNFDLSFVSIYQDQQ